MTVPFQREFSERKFLGKLTSSDNLLTSSVMGVIYFPQHRFKLVNRLKSRQGAFKICWNRREDVKVALSETTRLEFNHLSAPKQLLNNAAAVKYKRYTLQQSETASTSCTH